MTGFFVNSGRSIIDSMNQSFITKVLKLKLRPKSHVPLTSVFFGTFVIKLFFFLVFFLEHKICFISFLQISVVFYSDFYLSRPSF